jgi:hypothetical protein
VSYAVNDGVFYNGSSYRALVPMTAPAPGPTLTGSTFWALIAEEGDTGATGPKGDTGNTGSTGPPGINWRGDWVTGGNYNVNDAVYYSGSTFRCYVSIVGSPTPPDGDTAHWLPVAIHGATTGATNWRGSWVSLTVYSVNDAVTYNGSSYRRTVDGDGSDPPNLDTGNWELMAAKGDPGPTGATGLTGAAGVRWRGNWDPDLSYATNDGVYYNGSSYIRLSPGGINSNTPDTDPSRWSLLALKGTDGVSPSALWNWKGTWVNTSTYLHGDLVEYLGSTYYATVDISAGTVPSTGGSVWDLVAQKGVAGATGAQGIAGPTGPIGPAGLTWRGVWDGATAYINNDAVVYSGSSYRRITGGTTSVPPNIDTTNWQLIAQQGATGPTGSTGPPGPAAEFYYQSTAPSSAGVGAFWVDTSTPI